MIRARVAISSQSVKPGDVSLSWHQRVQACDWPGIGVELDAYGCALTSALLTVDEAGAIAALVAPGAAGLGAVGHVATTCVHAGSRPIVSMSNISWLVLPSGIDVPSPICR